jgi:hypothetical protein
MNNDNENLEPEELIPDKEICVLTEVQKSQILQLLNEAGENPPRIRDLIRNVLKKENSDARSKEGLAIREFISQQGVDYLKSNVYIKRQPIELSEEKKQFIIANCRTMKPLEMARHLWNDFSLTNLSAETRAIYSFIKNEIPEQDKIGSINTDTLNVEDYRPPVALDHCIVRINEYITGLRYEKSKLTERQKREVRALISYLHTLRLIAKINTYAEEKYRKLFESEFIRCTYNKENLSQEEIDQYIMYSSEVVTGNQIEARIEQLERQQDEFLETEGGGRIRMDLVEMVTSLRPEFNQCIIRQRALLKTLSGERKERLGQEGKKQNIADLFLYWQNEEKRGHLMKLAELRRKKLQNEIDRLENMDELKVEIFGLTAKEIMD